MIGPPVGALLATHSYELLFVAEGAAFLLVRLVTARMLPRFRSTRSFLGARDGPWPSLRADRST